MPLHELIHNCSAILPELILALTICAVILADMFTPLRHSRSVCGFVALIGAFWALVALVAPAAASLPAGDLWGGMIVHDGLASYFKLLFLLGTLATILFSLRSDETRGYRQGEYFSLLLGAALGACLMVASRNFIMLVVALETLSLCSYVLAGFIKHERPSAEAGLKYLLYGAVASGVMLFGISYLYGMTGTLDIGKVMRALNVQATLRDLAPAVLSGQLLSVLLALVLVLVGFGFKMAMVPFQFWCPDVYQGAPTPVTAFLSVVSKAAGFGALLRLFLPLFDTSGSALVGAIHLSGLFAVLAVATMTFGNLVALRQTDVKRLLAYSSIAHAGYILLGMTVFSHDSLQAMLFYFAVYLFMNLGAFWVVIVMINKLGGAELSRFRGARVKAPFLFWVMFLFLISLTGLPPTAGFIAKFVLFKVIVGAGVTAMQGGTITPTSWFYFILAFIGMINSAISLYYYMKIARFMALDAPVDEVPLPVSGIDAIYALLFAGPTLALFFFFPFVLQLADLF